MKQFLAYTMSVPGSYAVADTEKTARVELRREWKSVHGGPLPEVRVRELDVPANHYVWVRCTPFGIEWSVQQETCYRSGKDVN